MDDRSTARGGHICDEPMTISGFISRYVMSLPSADIAAARRAKALMRQIFMNDIGLKRSEYEAK